MTASWTVVYEWTCTPVKTSERLSDAPETMQPPESSDETARPRRPSTSWTNFAGGVISP